MPFRTRYGKHYHMTEGCHGATIPCGTGGLTPCSDCCGAGHGGGATGPVLGGGTRMYSQGYDAETGTVPVRLSGDTGDASIVPVYDGEGNLTGIRVVGQDGTEFRLDDEARADAEETLRQAAVGAARDAISESANTEGLSSLEGAAIALREADRARMEAGREDDLRAADRVTESGASSQTAPTVAPGDILERIASLERELETLRAQAETEKAFPEPDAESPFLLAERSLDEETRSYLEKVYGKVTPELYAEHVVDAVSLIAYEVPNEMGRDITGGPDDATVLGRIADRLEAEGYGDKLDAEVEKRLGWDGDTEAIKAIGIVRARRRQRQDDRDWDVAERISDIQGEAMREMGLRSVPLDRREELTERIARKIQAEGLDGRLTDGVSDALTAMNAHTAGLAVARAREGASAASDGNAVAKGKAPATPSHKAQAKAEKVPAKRATRRRARKPADPLGGMTPEQEQGAFDSEFSTKSIEGYMGANGYEGSKSKSGLWGRELSGAVRTDMKTWLGHLGVPKGAVRVASHTYSGGQSLKVETKLDRRTYGASESEFKSAYRKHFWRVTPQWGTVETSTGPVDVSRLMEHGDAGRLMDDIIDTAWRKYQSGETEVDCGRSGAWGNPRQEIYLNEQGQKVARRMQQIVDAYNYDESNGQVDYFNSGFYAYPKVRLS